MNRWLFYAADSGIFTGAGIDGTAADAAAQLAHKGSGFAAFEGTADVLTQRVDISTGKLIDYQPPAPPPPTVAVVRAARQAALQEQIDTLESQQARAVRGVVTALSLPTLDAGQATQRDVDLAHLATIDAAIAPLRTKWQQLQAATTLAELDAVPP